MRRLLFVMGCVVPFLLARTLWAADASHDVIAGNYDMRICTGTCSFRDLANVAAEGTVILFAKALEKNDLERFDEHRFTHHSGEPINGCFTFRHVATSSANLWVEDVGVTSWSFENGRYGFALFHSPDAGYQVSVERTTTGLSGTGSSWGAGAAAPESPSREIVIARRTGDANLSNCTFQTADEREFNRLLADPARAEIFAIEDAYRKKLIADLQSSRSPRDWAMAGWLQKFEAGEAPILRARKAAPNDRFIRWMSAVRTHAETVPVSLNGASGFTFQDRAIDDAAVTELQRTDADNAFVWLASLREASIRNDQNAIDAALTHLAESKYYDDHAAELLKAQLDLFRRHRLPGDYFAAVARLDAGWRLNGAFTKDVAPYYENHYPFADIGIHNLFFFMEDDGTHELFAVCTQQAERSKARNDACIKSGRLLSAHSRRIAARDSGSMLLSEIGEFTDDDLARVRAQAWVAAKYNEIHPHAGSSGRPFVRDDIAFINDWLDSSDEYEAMRRAVVRAGKPLVPPDDFSLNKALYANFEIAHKKSSDEKSH